MPATNGSRSPERSCEGIGRGRAGGMGGMGGMGCVKIEADRGLSQRLVINSTSDDSTLVHHYPISVATRLNTLTRTTPASSDSAFSFVFGLI